MNESANYRWDVAFVFEDIKESLAAWENQFFQALDLHVPAKQIASLKSASHAGLLEHS